MSGRFDLREAFLIRQQKLRSDLGMGQITSHPTTRGEETEADWRGMLSEFLPHRYGVSKAFVVDVHADQSEQLDVVIHDRHFSPLLFEVGDSLYIPAESVYAIFEVKQALDKSNVEYASQKVASVRKLFRTSAPIPHPGGIFEPKKPPPILAGILATASNWKPAIGKPFIDALAQTSNEGRLDLGCVLDEVGFEIFWRIDRPMIDSAGTDMALIFFALRFLRRLQALGSAPAIDYEMYSQVALERDLGGEG